MPKILNTNTLLNQDVSCFETYWKTDNPKSVNLLVWLRSLKHRERVDEVRAIDDKKKRDELKAGFPVITPSGIFTYREESRCPYPLL